MPTVAICAAGVQILLDRPRAAADLWCISALRLLTMGAEKLHCHLQRRTAVMVRPYGKLNARLSTPGSCSPDQSLSAGMGLFADPAHLLGSAAMMARVHSLPLSGRPLGQLAARLPPDLGRRRTGTAAEPFRHQIPSNRRTLHDRCRPRLQRDSIPAQDRFSHARRAAAKGARVLARWQELGLYGGCARPRRAGRNSSSTTARPTPTATSISATRSTRSSRTW